MNRNAPSQCEHEKPGGIGRIETNLDPLADTPAHLRRDVVHPVDGDAVLADRAPTAFHGRLRQQRIEKARIGDLPQRLMSQPAIR